MAAPMQRTGICKSGFRIITKILQCKGLRLLPKNNLCSSAAANTKGASQVAGPWKLVSAVCVERMPIIGHAKTEKEARFAELLDTLEFENSLMSNHELRHLEDLKIAERRKQEDFEETEETLSRQTAREAEDVWENQFKEFTPANTVTEADKQNDLTSTDRQLDRKLILLIKQKLGSDNVWVLPQGFREEGESMRQTADRVLSERCGQDLKVQFLGNAPCGFYKYHFPSDVAMSSGAVGAKVFIFKAQLTKGNVSQTDNTTISQHVWVTKDDICSYITRENARDNVKRSILDI